MEHFLLTAIDETIHKGFHQALIDCHVSNEFDFNLMAFRDKYPTEVENLLKEFPPTNKIVDTARASLLRDKLIELYELMVLGKKDYINSNLNNKTYLFKTNYSAESRRNHIYGQASLKAGSCNHDICTNSEWGNAVVIFQSGLTSNETYLHELGHSFSLTHIFEENGNLRPKHTFYQAYTDNVMDYNSGAYHNDKNNPNLEFTSPSIYKEQQWSFFKWQWDIMRQDRSSIYP